MQTLIFDIRGEIGQFKKPYSPMSPVTYPIPPPTAVLGILGAIAGFAKDSCHEELGWERVRVAVGLRAPVQLFRTALNLLNTKDGTDSFFRPRAGTNTHIQAPYEFLKEPAFRLYVTGVRAEALTRLGDNLAAGRTVYTPVLGLASCLAEVDWVGLVEATPGTEARYRIDTVAPLNPGILVHYEDHRRYHRLRVPAVMDGRRIVHRYQEVVVPEDGGPMQVEGGEYYRVNDATIAFL